MRKYRKLYIIIVVAYAALLVVSRIYSVSSFLVDIVYLFSWIVLLFLEIRKQYHVKKMIKGRNRLFSYNSNFPDDGYLHYKHV